MPRRATDTPILHVDLDAFYASVATLRDPALAGRPVIVAGGGRGVVLSASYEARAHGVHAAMPTVRARRLCPDAAFVPPDFEAYRAHSIRFREVLLSVTPLVEPLSLDEAFLDVAGAVRLFGEPPAIAERIRADVRAEVGVACSVGVAPNKLVAKIASAAAKPDGAVVVPAGGVETFLGPLPVERLWGVGEKTLELLHRLGIRTIADLVATPAVVLGRLLGDGPAASLRALGCGDDDRPVVPYQAPKQVSHEETFDRDLDDETEILREVLALSQRVGTRLREEGYRARTVVLKVRLASFTTITRSRTLAAPTDVAADLYRTAAELYRALPGSSRRVRLLGVAATNLGGAGAEQLALLHPERWGDIERAVDRVDRRFGRGSAFPAALLDRHRD
ncbi:MAG: DNA polymerase IV [Actinomycetota bacterium]